MATAPANDQSSQPTATSDTEGRSAEDVAKQESEPGRDDAGTKGSTKRPTGTSDKVRGALRRAWTGLRTLVTPLARGLGWRTPRRLGQCTREFMLYHDI